MRRYAFPASRRIRSSGEYDRVFAAGRSVHTAHFRVVAAPAGTPESRLGTVVSRKTGDACRRNRIKRLLREYFRLRRPDLQSPVDVVVIAKPGADTLSLPEVAGELDAALKPWFGGSQSP